VYRYRVLRRSTEHLAAIAAAANVVLIAFIAFIAPAGPLLTVSMLGIAIGRCGWSACRCDRVHRT
jgi:hypothetical protein